MEIIRFAFFAYFWATVCFCEKKENKLVKRAVQLPTTVPTKGVQVKVLTSFKFDNRDYTIWTQNDTDISLSGSLIYYILPPVKFLPRRTLCKYSLLTDEFKINFDIRFWDDSVEAAAFAELQKLSIMVVEGQIKALPFHQVRAVWKSSTPPKYFQVDPTWIENFERSQIHTFSLKYIDGSICSALAANLRNNPQDFTDSIRIEYSTTIPTVSEKTLTVQWDYIINAPLYVKLLAFCQNTGTCYVQSRVISELNVQVANRLVSSQHTTGYMEEQSEISLLNVVNKALKQETIMFNDMVSWNSVYWNPLSARPDNLAALLNDLLQIDRNLHKVTLKNIVFYDNGIHSEKVVKMFQESVAKNETVTILQLISWLNANRYPVTIKDGFFRVQTIELYKINVTKSTQSRDNLQQTLSVKIRKVDKSDFLEVTLIDDSSDNERYRHLDNKSRDDKIDALQAKMDTIETKFKQLNEHIQGMFQTVSTNTSI